LPHLRIYTNESGTVSAKTAGGSDEVNGQRETENDKDHSYKVAESIKREPIAISSFINCDIFMQIDSKVLQRENQTFLFCLDISPFLH
jgi:hypothetical protein